MPEAILGISAYYHDSTAALLLDGKLIAAAQEERFSRIKHDASFPAHAVAYVLREGGMTYDELSAVAYYEKPLLKFERLLETYHAFAPRGLSNFLKSMPIWVKDKVFFRKMLARELSHFGQKRIPLYFSEHHLSHAASAFYPSPFEQAAILTIDGVGEWTSTMLAYGEGNKIWVLEEQHFPHSIGLLYSAFTYYLGFEVNGGEYKLMGLAAYGNPNAAQTKGFLKKIRNEMVDMREDGSILLNMRYFRFATHLRMTDDHHWLRLFGLRRRDPSNKLEQSHADLALAIQQLVEEVVQQLATSTLRLTGADQLVMAGGVALNSVANGKLLDLPGLKSLWVQPAAGDAGGALGAAFALWHIHQARERKAQLPDAMNHALLGPSYAEVEIERVIRKFGLKASKITDEKALLTRTVDFLTEGKVVGWFQGRMEFGPRALGNRSILGDPRRAEMQHQINLSIKFRESFRPFAPIVLEEEADQYFDLDTASPYMLLVRPVKKDRRFPVHKEEHHDLMERLKQPLSDIPAVTHVDYSARIQTLGRGANDRFRALLQTFKERTGYGMLINTSFNIKDEPIVCSPEDAIRCFLKTKMDVLVIGDFILLKNVQLKTHEEIRL